MNHTRRVAIKAAFGACVAALWPWKKPPVLEYLVARFPDGDVFECNLSGSENARGRPVFESPHGRFEVVFRWSDGRVERTGDAKRAREVFDQMVWS